MRHSYRFVPHRDTLSLVGWLFADLLLGLAMLFFVFNTVGPQPPAPTQTPYPSLTPAPTQTRYPTLTPVPTQTAVPTQTPYPSLTPVPTQTPYPSLTPVPTQTPYPTLTSVPTQTPYPSLTPVPTQTPYPTLTPDPTYTPPPAPFVAGLEKQPEEFRFYVDIPSLSKEPPDPGEVRRVRALLLQRFGGLQNYREAGFVLTEVKVRSGNEGDRRPGLAAARQINALLAQELPAVFTNAASEVFFEVDASNVGASWIRVYLLLGP